jgi:steroid delta-isomerase-like uncharacterized protein
MATEQERNKAVILQMFEETWNRGNLDYINLVVAEDFRDYTPQHFFTPPLLGRQALYDAVKGFREGFSDFHFQMIQIVAEGAHVTYLGRATGTHDGTFFDVPPTGKKVSVIGINEFHLVGGKIVERWSIFDLLGMMQQLGIGTGPGGH